MRVLRDDEPEASFAAIVFDGAGGKVVGAEQMETGE
jgi:hypothetical protein